MESIFYNNEEIRDALIQLNNEYKTIDDILDKFRQISAITYKMKDFFSVYEKLKIRLEQTKDELEKLIIKGKEITDLYDENENKCLELVDKLPGIEDVIDNTAINIGKYDFPFLSDLSIVDNDSYYVRNSNYVHEDWLTDWFYEQLNRGI